MKKIKSVRQLNDHKQHVNYRLDELDKNIHRQWIELKTMLAPSKIISDCLETVEQKKPETGLENRSIWRNLFTYGAGILAGKLADKVSKKFSSN